MVPADTPSRRLDAVVLAVLGALTLLFGGVGAGASSMAAAEAAVDEATVQVGRARQTTRRGESCVRRLRPTRPHRPRLRARQARAATRRRVQARGIWRGAPRRGPPPPPHAA